MIEHMPPFKKKRVVTIREVLKVYWKHTLAYKWSFFLSFFLGTTTYLFDVITPLFFKRFFDVLGGTPSSETLQTLLGVLTVIIFFNVLQWIARRAMHFLTIYFYAGAMSDLLDNGFIYLFGHSYNFFISNFTGTLVRRVTRLSRSYETIMDQLFYNIQRSTLLGYALLLWIVLFLLVQLALARWKQPYNLRKAEEDSRVTGTLSDAVSNEYNIKLFSGANHEEGLFRNVTADLKRITLLSWTIDEVINTVQGFLMIVIQGVLFYGAIVFWQRGVLTIGDFALIQAYLINIFGQLWNFGNSFRRLYEAFADASEMVEIFNTPHEIRDAPGAKVLSVPNGEIQFKDVHFRFHKDQAILEEFSLRIAPGEKIALVGPSGAGKSTIVKILFRLYDIRSGSILIDGQDIHTVTQESLHDAISLVPQEPILFHRTLLENIRYGRRDATDEEVMEAARQAHCHEFITRFPEGYDTFVGERGVKLSGGEKQRVAIARAILKNAPVLVLDEATSSLDSHSEALIQDALEVLMKGKTVIVIAHRLSTIMKMDRIVVMQGGQVIDQGTHADLLSRDSLYKRLWDIQAGGFLRE